jgi:hypothetical protein
MRVLLGAWILPVAAMAAQTVEGRVVNAATGEVLAGAAVTIAELGDSAKHQYRAATDGEGRFRIENVADGIYTARYGASHFWSTNNPFSEAQRPGFQVTANGEPVHLEARLQPVPRIEGRVQDAEGNPVPNANVWLVWQIAGCGPPSCFPFSRQTKTDSRGEYVMGDPDMPGIWLLSAAAPAGWKPPKSNAEQLGWTQTYYPGVSNRDLSARISVQPGVEVGRLDIKLAAVPVHWIRGVVHDPTGDPVAKAPVTLFRTNGPAFEQETKEDGVFEFGAVPDGNWLLRAGAEKGPVRLWAGESREVKARDLENVELRLAAPFTLRGKFVVEVPEGMAAPVWPRDFILMNADGTEPDTRPGHPDADGNFTVLNVYPGRYLISVLDSGPRTFFIDSIRLGARETIGSIVPVVSADETVTVTYKTGGGTVRGSIDGCGSAHVMLIPVDEGLRRGEFVRQSNCRASGQFDFSNVRPGEYYGIAIDAEGSELMAALRDSALLRQAKHVTVRQNEHTAAEIPLVRK